MTKKKSIYYRWYLISFLLGILFLTGCERQEEVLFFSADNTEVEENKTLTEIPEIAEPIKEVIFVDVCGAVACPGVYELEAGTRVYQAVEAAGGFLEEADARGMNQARILKDEEMIYIPTSEEVENQLSGNEIGINSLEQKKETPDGRIDLNTADLDQLMKLTGIGETRARAILSYREENGRFSSIDEIMNVQGIKEGTFVKIKDEIVVG